MTIPLDTISLRPQFRGEHVPPDQNRVFPGRQVRYLTAEERLAYRLYVNERGLLADANGNLFDTATGESMHTPEGGRAIFVMDAQGNLYASNKHVAGEFQHSSFLAGAPVAGAGELKVTNGQLELVSNKSHHYRPPPRYIAQTVRHMVHELGVKIDANTQLQTVDWPEPGV